MFLKNFRHAKFKISTHETPLIGNYNRNLTFNILQNYIQMKELDTFSDYLSELTKEKWDSLFELIPEIENTTEFGAVKGGDMISGGLLHMPHYRPTPVVRKFLKIVQELQLAPVFEWTAWKAGKKIIQESDSKISKLNLEDTCKLFTIIIREDRLNDGFLGVCFENGTVLKILKHIKEIVLK